MASSRACLVWCAAAVAAWRPACIAVLACTLAACSSADTCKMVRATDLPIDIEDGHLVTNVEINGRPGRMMLDTGSDTTVLSARAVTRLGLPAPYLTGGTVSGIGGSREFSVMNTAKFKLGEMHGRDLAFGVIDSRNMLDLESLDGIVGMDLLSQAELDIDLPGHKMILYRVVEGCTRPTAALDPPLYMLPMTQTAEEARVTIHVTIGGRRLLALLDTGAPKSIIFRGAARSLGLDEAALAQDPAGTLSGIGSHVVRAHSHVVEPVTIGDLTIRNMPATISEERGTDGLDMILGMDFFEHVHVWISPASHMLIMQFPPAPSPPRAP